MDKTAFLAAAAIAFSLPAWAAKPYHVESVQHGAFIFKPSQQEVAAGVYNEEMCPGLNCVCTAAISRVVIAGHDAAARKINTALKAAVTPACSLETASTITTPAVTFVNKDLFSVVLSHAVRGQGGNATHEWVTADLYDRKTGRPYRLRDAVAPGRLDEAMHAMAKSVLAASSKTDNAAAQDIHDLAREMSGSKGDIGLFIKNGKLMAQFNHLSYFSNSDGHSAAAQVPVTLIVPPALRAGLSLDSKPAP